MTKAELKEAIAEYLYEIHGRCGGLDWGCLWEGANLKWECRKEADKIIAQMESK